MKLVLDAARSQLRVHTYAEGFFSKLAHDLELTCRDMTGSAERVGADEGTASITVPVHGIDVSGVLKGGRVDSGGLLGIERSECLSKMRKDVFQASSDTGAAVRATIAASAGKARVTITMPSGREVGQEVSYRHDGNAPDTLHVSGSFSLSLQAIGSAPVKGPMNAFRVKDGIDLLFDVRFVPAT